MERADTVDGLYHIGMESSLSLPSRRRFGCASAPAGRLLALPGVDRAPRCQARAGYLNLPLLAPRRRALALVVAVQDEDLAIAGCVTEDPQDELLCDLVVGLDGAVDAE